MDVLTSEVGYTLATTGRGDHEVHKGHVVALGGLESSEEPAFSKCVLCNFATSLPYPLCLFTGYTDL
jgi:hypothetical protein